MSFLVEIPQKAYRPDAFDRFCACADFDLGTARAMMWMSQLAYESRDAPEKISPVLKSWQLRCLALLANGRRRTLALNSTRGIVATGRGATFVAFSGTDPLALPNWTTNLNLGPRPRPVHRGFESAVDAVWPALSQAIRAARDGNHPLFMTGHSLGGALAIVAAERAVRELGVTPTAVYAFGSPRVAGSDFARAYRSLGLSERTFRLVHGLDMIAAIPPSRLGFRHVGRLVACERGRAFEHPQKIQDGDCDDPQFVPTLARGYRQRLSDLMTGQRLPSSRRGFLGWYQTFVLPPTIVDHLPERYRSACDNSAGVRPQPDPPLASRQQYNLP